MLYSIKNPRDLENLNKLVSLQNQVQEVKLQDKLGKQNYHHKTEKIFEPLTDTIDNTSENLTKTLTGKSIINDKAIEFKRSNFRIDE